MKIAKYVGNLLYDHECVVIPGLGGFITKNQSVTISEVTHSFSPPFKNVFFNVHLRANDGLLVNHVAQQEQIEYQLAKQRVDQFAFQCHNALKSGKRITFKNIGSLYLNPEKNIVFKQDTANNYDPNSFGLSSLVSPAIRRVTDEQKVKEVVKSIIDKKPINKKRVDKKITPKKDKKYTPVRNMQATRRKSTFTNQLIFLLLVGLIMGSGYIYMRRDAMGYYFDKYSAHIPFFYSSVNDYLATNINSTHVAKLSRSTASFFPDFNKSSETPTTINNENIDFNASNNPDNEIITESDIVITNDADMGNTETTFEEVKEVTEKSIPEKININNTPAITIAKSAASNNFFIIAGSFSSEQNANTLVNKLKAQGFEALIADTNKYGMYRVAFVALNNRATAERNLSAIRRKTNPKAWLLVK